jgi:hypothetical protein
MKKTSPDREKKLQLHKETLTRVMAGDDGATITVWTCPDVTWWENAACA